MRKHLKIANIYLDFSYQYDDYFSDKINAYETSDLNHDFIKMTVQVKDEITFPKREVTLKHENRYKLESDKDCYIVVKVEDEIKYLIYYTLDYKLIEITLNKKLRNRLAEYEYVITGMVFFDIAILNNYLPIHASAISYQNLTFLLSGPSKTGKSTQTNYFLAKYPESIVINEDKPLIFLKENSFYVSGTPWSGKDVINTNIEKRLDYIFFINQSDEKMAVELDKKTKIKHLFRNIHRPSEEHLVDNLALIIDGVIEDIKIYVFNCENDISSSEYLKKFMEDNL